MTIESGRSPDRGSDRSMESRHKRDKGDRSSDGFPTVERGLAVSSDPTIEEARKRAIESATKQEERTSFFKQGSERLSRPLKVIARVGVDSIKVAGEVAGVFAFLGLKTARPIARRMLIGIDWLGQKMNSLGDKLMGKNFPVLSWILNPAFSLLDSAAKALGWEKALAEHLKKNEEDRKKLAAKLISDYVKASDAAEKKSDAATAKAKRRKFIEDRLGTDVAAAIEDDVDAAAVAASATTASSTGDSIPVVAPTAEVPKTT